MALYPSPSSPTDFAEEPFNQGRVIRAYRIIQIYTDRRLRRWLIRRQGQRGTGYRKYPDEYLYETLGLYRLPQSRSAVAKAKA